MQQEREAWQREKTALHAELEQLKRSHTLGSPSVGRNSPLDQHAKSSSPTSDDDDLEISMIKVQLFPCCVSESLLLCDRLLRTPRYSGLWWSHLKRSVKYWV